MVEKATQPKVRQIAFGVVRKGKIMVWAGGSLVPKKRITSFKVGGEFEMM